MVINKNDKEGEYLRVGKQAWKQAHKDLSPSGFALYLYFAENANNWHEVLFKVKVMEELEISEATYKRAIKDLKEHKYLIPREGSNLMDFYVVAQK